MAFSKRQKLRDNIEAIRTAFERAKDHVRPSAEDVSVMRKYAGFGGLKCILQPAEKDSDVEKWTSDRELFPLVRELHKVILTFSHSRSEYKNIIQKLQRSVLTAFYTPAHFTRTLASTLFKNGAFADKILEPSAGVGQFIESFREIYPHAEFTGIEKDALTGIILKSIYPDDTIYGNDGFEVVGRFYDNHFGMIVSNIPFGETSLYDSDFSHSPDPVR